MRKLIFTGLALLLAVGVGVLFVLLERHAAYRSPFYRENPQPTPRQLALLKMELEANSPRKKATVNSSPPNKPAAEQLVEAGREIVYGKGLCMNCHRIGDDGAAELGPNLEGIGARAGETVPGMTDVEYLTESVYQPDAYIVPEYVPTMMPVDGPPMMLNEQEVLAVVAFLQSLGSSPTVTPETVLPRPD